MSYDQKQIQRRAGTTASGRGTATGGARGAAHAAARTLSFDAGQELLSPRRLAPRPVQLRAASKGKGKQGTIEKLAPKDMSLDGLRLNFTLTGPRVLSKNYKATVSIPGDMSVSVAVNRRGLSIDMSAYVDATWPAKNMFLQGVRLDFKTGAVDVDIQQAGGRGFLDFSKTAKATVRTMIKDAIKGSPMDKPGYDPFADPNVMKTLQKIKSTLGAMPSSGGKPVGAKDVKEVGVGASLTLEKGFKRLQGGKGVSIAANTSFTVTLASGARLDTILQGKDAKDKLERAGLKAIGLSASPGITIIAGGKPVARITSLKLESGGTVRVGHVETLGAVKGAENAGKGLEFLARLLYHAERFKDRGLPPQLGAHNAVKNGQAAPKTTEAAKTALFELLLTDAAKQLIRSNRNAIPGLDLAALLAVK